MQENLAGVRVVKAFVRMQHEERRFGSASEDLMARSLDVARMMAMVLPFMMLTMNLGVVGVLCFGGVQVIQGTMQLGQIIAFINYQLTTLFS